MSFDSLPMSVLLLLIFPLLFLLLLKKRRTQKANLPPGPPKLPILGNLHQLGEIPHRSLAQLSKKYGPVVFLKLGQIPVVVFSSAETAKEVLVNHDLKCCSRPRLTSSGVLSYNHIDIGFSPYGEYWREIRKICILELFSVKRIQSFHFITQEEVASVIESISKSTDSATPVDLSEKMFSLGGSIVLRKAFGKTFKESNFDSKRFGELVHEVEAFMGRYTMDELVPYVGWIVDRITGFHSRLQKVFNELDSFFQQVIDEHLMPDRRKQEQDDFIDVLLKVEKELVDKSGKPWLTKNHIKAILLDVFIAASESTASTLLWAMAELIKKPKIMKKVQDEVRNCVGKNGKVCYGDTDRMPYLKMVIKETLRLHPTGPLLIPRETMSPFNVNGYEINPKTLIQVNVWEIGRDPKYWTNPEEFFPERFLDSSVDYKGQHFHYLPFGSGRRICPAINLGVATVEFALANFLYCLDWKLPEGMKEEDVNMDETVGVSLAVNKKTPLNIVPVKYP